MRARTLAYALVLAVCGVALGATPAGAQQLIDATTDGGLAFVAFTIMVVLFTLSLFYLDRIRRRREADEDEG